MNPAALEVDRLDDGQPVLLSNEIQIGGTFNFDRQAAVVGDAECSPNPAMCLESQAASKRISLVLFDRKRSGCTNSLVGFITKKETAGNRERSPRNHVGVAHIA